MVIVVVGRGPLIPCRGDGTGHKVETTAMLLEAVVLCVPWQLLAKQKLGKDVVTKGPDS